MKLSAIALGVLLAASLPTLAHEVPAGLAKSPPSGAYLREPFEELGRSQVRKLLEKAVDELPDNFRAVFVLRDIEEMSAEDTAGLLSLKLETVKTRLHRARRLLRAALEKRLSAAFTELSPSMARAASAWPIAS